jgi:hypothetical protein
MRPNKKACETGYHSWQAVAVPIQMVGELGQAKLMIQFFRVCPWCKISEDMPGKMMTPGRATPALLS